MVSEQTSGAEAYPFLGYRFESVTLLLDKLASIKIFHIAGCCIYWNKQLGGNLCIKELIDQKEAQIFDCLPK